MIIKIKKYTDHIIVIILIVLFFVYSVQNQKNKFFEFKTEIEFQKIDIEFVKGLGDYISDNEKVIINDERNDEFKKLLKNSETDYFSSLKISDYKIIVHLYLKDNKRKKLRLAYDDEDGFIFDFDGIHFRNNELALYIVDLLKIKRKE